MRQLHFLLLLIFVSKNSAKASHELRPIDVASPSVLESEYLSPVPIKIISKEEILLAGAIRLQELLYLKEGLSMVRSGNKLAPSIRGFNPEHTLFLINGQRLANEPTNKFDLERLDLTTVERIEIIKGPLSTIYGADALGGVINIITGPITTDKVSFSGRTSAYDYKSPRHAVATQIDKKLGNFGISVFGTHIKEDPLFYNKRETVDDKKEVASLGTALHFTKGSLTFKGRQTWSKDTHEALYYNFLNSNYVFDDDSHRRTLSSGELAYQSGRVRHIGAVSHSSYKKKGDTHLQDNNLLLMRKRARIYLTEMSYRSELSLEDHKITAGIGHRKEDFFGNAFNYDNNSHYLPGYSWIYFVDQWATTERLMLVPSVRHEKINYFDDKTLVQLGATLFLDKNFEQNLKFNFAQGYRVPTPKDLYVDVMIMKGNPHLNAETTNSYNIEYGLMKKSWDMRASYFYNDIDGLIQEYYKPSLGKYTFRNVKDTHIHGTEIMLRKRFSVHEHALSHTFLEAREKSGSRLPNRARHQIVFNTTYFLSRVTLLNDLSCRSDELLYDENHKLREFTYCSVDLAVQYKLKKYQLSIKGTNLLDDFKRALPQRPRLISLFVNTQF